MCSDTCQYLVTFKPLNNLEPGRGGGQACMQASLGLFYRSLKERREGLEAFQTSCGRRRRRRTGRIRRRMMMMRRRWSGREGMRMICRTAWWWRRAWWSKSLWSLLILVFFPCRSFFNVLFTEKMFNNHIVEVHNDQPSWIILCLLRHQIICHMWENSFCCWIGSLWGDKAQERDRVHPCNFKAWQHSGHVFVCKGCCNKFGPNNSINRHTKLLSGKPHHRNTFKKKKHFSTQPCGERITTEEILLWGGWRRGRGRFWTAPGRGQTSSTILIGNLSCWFS